MTTFAFFGTLDIIIIIVIVVIVIVVSTVTIISTRSELSSESLLRLIIGRNNNSW